MLKIKLWRIENVILMKIFEQNSLIRKELTPFTATNGIRIRSADYPQLEYDVIYLRGVPENDQMISVFHCATPAQAKRKLDLYKEALEEFVEHCKSKNPQNEDYVISDVETYRIGD